jgi:hypothetical protein
MKIAVKNKYIGWKLTPIEKEKIIRVKLDRTYM